MRRVNAHEACQLDSIFMSHGSDANEELIYMVCAGVSADQFRVVIEVTVAGSSAWMHVFWMSFVRVHAEDTLLCCIFSRTRPKSSLLKRLKCGTRNASIMSKAASAFADRMMTYFMNTVHNEAVAERGAVDIVVQDGRYGERCDSDERQRRPTSTHVEQLMDT